MKNIVKSIGAVLAGFISVGALSTITDAILHAIGILPNGALFDTPLLLLALGYRTVYTIFGGYLTAKLAPHHPMRHVIILAIIGVVIGSIGAVVMKEYGPGWYSWGIVVLSIPSILLGAKLAKRSI